MHNGETLRRTWQPSFRALGFPVHVRPGFFVFIVLALVAYRGALGPWLAGSIAVLTVTHELGHATIARLHGARAEISLDMFAGYTTYEPTREMTAPERAMIALAGPLAQIVPAVLVLIAMGFNPLLPPGFDDPAAAKAIWWAGPALGIFNLLPLVPLDGGVIVSAFAERRWPEHGRRYVHWGSIALTALVTLGLVLNETTRPTAFFSGALLVFQLAQLRSEHREPKRLAAVASPGWSAIRELLDRDEYVKAGQYGATLFRQGGHADIAVLVARAATHLDELTTAMAWLQAAAIAADDPELVIDQVETDPEFAPVRAHTAFGALHLVLTS